MHRINVEEIEQPIKVIITFTLIMATGFLGCAPANPKAVCIMQNPSTGARVEMYKEIRYKVPANYDEKKHIEEWKAQQMKKGYSVEIKE